MRKVSGFKRGSSQKKGQFSIEFVITIGFALLIILPMTVLLYEHSSKSYEQVNSNQAGLIARKIVDSADSVYYMGHPSTITLKLYMPDNIKQINISGREIVFLLDNGNEIVSLANVNLTGIISPSSGTKYIKIFALEKSVNISEDGI